MPIKKFASGKDDPRRKGVFVIKYTLGENPSFFKMMTGIGPAYGATLDETPRFNTALDASDQILEFPLMASVGAEIYEIVGGLTLTADQRSKIGTLAHNRAFSARDWTEYGLPEALLRKAVRQGLISRVERGKYAPTRRGWEAIEAVSALNEATGG